MHTDDIRWHSVFCPHSNCSHCDHNFTAKTWISSTCFRSGCDRLSHLCQHHLSNCSVQVCRFNVQKVPGLILNSANNIENKLSLVITSNLETWVQQTVDMHCMMHVLEIIYSVHNHCCSMLLLLLNVYCMFFIHAS